MKSFSQTAYKKLVPWRFLLNKLMPLQVEVREIVCRCTAFWIRLFRTSDGRVNANRRDKYYVASALRMAFSVTTELQK